MPWFWISGSRALREKNFCCLKPPSWWWFFNSSHRRPVIQVILTRRRKKILTMVRTEIIYRGGRLWCLAGPLIWHRRQLQEDLPFLFIFFKDFIYLFLERGKGGGKKHQCVLASHATPHRVPGPQPRHVLWLGIELLTLQFAGQRLIHWATPARADLPVNNSNYTCVSCVLYVCLIVLKNHTQY